jgi:hypothetical protein
LVVAYGVEQPRPLRQLQGRPVAGRVLAEPSRLEEAGLALENLFLRNPPAGQVRPLAQDAQQFSLALEKAQVTVPLIRPQ